MSGWGLWAGSYSGQRKAVASASGDLTPRAEHSTLRAIAMAKGNHMFYGQGAVPIFRNGCADRRYWCR